MIKRGSSPHILTSFFHDSNIESYPVARGAFFRKGRFLRYLPFFALYDPEEHTVSAIFYFLIPNFFEDILTFFNGSVTIQS